MIQIPRRIFLAIDFCWPLCPLAILNARTATAPARGEAWLCLNTIILHLWVDFLPIGAVRGQIQPLSVLTDLPQAARDRCNGPNSVRRIKILLSTQMEPTLPHTRTRSGVSAYSVMQIKQLLKSGYLHISRKKYPSLSSAISPLGTRVTQARLWGARELMETPTHEGIWQLGALPV